MIAPAEELPKQVRPALRPETIIKWRAIASHGRWTDTETADVLADFYLKHHTDIEVPSSTCPPSSPSDDATSQRTESDGKSQA